MGQINKLIACFKESEFRFDNTIFEHGVIAQKMNCLLQYRGMNNRYAYFLHFHGPYSRELADDLFRNAGEAFEFNTNVRLTPEEVEKVNEWDRIFRKSPSYLEIASTYAYYCIDDQLNPLDAYRKTKRFKSVYSDGKIAIGISKAKEFLFSPKIEDEMNVFDEFKAWQDLSFRTLERF